MAELIIVAAVARNGIIGGANQLLWHVPADLKRFRALTMGKPMIMGRKTFASIGRPLPGRETIVVTRDRDFAVPGVHIVHEIAEALTLAEVRAQAMGTAEMILAGGGELYAALIQEAARLHMTEVDVAPEGDTLFPAIDPALWCETSREILVAASPGEIACAFVDFVRRR